MKKRYFLLIAFLVMIVNLKAKAQVYAPEVQVQPTPDNNVGINKSDPQRTLDVNGEGRFSSSLEVGGKTLSKSLDIGLIRNPNSSPGGLNIHSSLEGDWTNFQFAEHGITGSHAILFNAYKSNSLVSGSLSVPGNTRYAYDVGTYASGAGAIMFFGNGGTMDFLISPESTGKDTDILWGVPKMRISRNGNVAIGYEIPEHTLDVNGSGHFSSTLKVDGATRLAHGLDIGLPRNPNSSWDGLNIHSGAGGNYTSFQFAEDSWSGSHAILFNSYKSNIPVNGGLKATGNTRYANHPGTYGNGAAAIMFSGNGGAMEFLISPASTGKDDNILWGGTKMIIRRNGFVGIGKDPDYKLDVDGTVRATTFSAVSPPWADFVFQEDYSLMPLQQVENYIQKNKHLPHVPSARQVEKEGVNLAKMDAVLLRKIEELTLYIIQQNKRIEELEKKVNQQE